jgi:hypothetical protein
MMRSQTPEYTKGSVTRCEYPDIEHSGLPIGDQAGTPENSAMSPLAS